MTLIIECALSRSRGYVYVKMHYKDEEMKMTDELAYVKKTQALCPCIHLTFKNIRRDHVQSLQDQLKGYQEHYGWYLVPNVVYQNIVQD